jgi:hypothetical protein
MTKWVVLFLGSTFVLLSFVLWRWSRRPVKIKMEASHGVKLKIISSSVHVSNLIRGLHNTIGDDANEPSNISLPGGPSIPPPKP